MACLACNITCLILYYLFRSITRVTHYFNPNFHFVRTIYPLFETTEIMIANVYIRAFKRNVVLPRVSHEASSLGRRDVLRYEEAGVDAL